MAEGLKNFITVQRSVVSDYHNHLMTRQERQVYVWLRMVASPYAKATVSLGSLAADCLGDVTENYVNKILLSLKRKRYIHYPERSGRRGSFEIELGDWALPRKHPGDPVKINTLDRHFVNEDAVRGNGTDTGALESEDTAELSSQGQRSQEKDYDVSASLSNVAAKLSVRGLHTDTETHTEKETDVRRSGRPFKKGIAVEAFVPATSDERECLQIAQELGEPTMDFLLSSLRKHGMRRIQRAWESCRESKGFKAARNRGAYFNSVLTSILTDSQTI